MNKAACLLLTLAIVGCVNKNEPFDRAIECAAVGAVASRLVPLVNPQLQPDVLEEGTKTFVERALYEGKKIGLSSTQVEVRLEAAAADLKEKTLASGNGKEVDIKPLGEKLNECSTELKIS